MKSLTYILITFLWASAAFVNAGTNGFLNPPFRGAASTEAGYWESFTAAVGAPGNRADRPGATTDAVLTQSDTNAFLTGSGNIYNLTGISSFTVAGTAPYAIGTIVLQVRTIGGEVDANSVSLSYTTGAGQQIVTPLPRVELNRASQPGVGATVSSLWQWNLSGQVVTTYTISFRASKTSLSLDALTLDTAAQFVPLFTPPFTLTNSAPSIERWMYANNAAPCDRPAGAVFGSFGGTITSDTRHAQQLAGWDTAAFIPTNRGAARYHVTRCRVTLTINRGNIFAFDPTHDGYRTYFESNDPGYMADSDAGRPIELFGVGYRNGFTAATFDQCAPFGTNTAGNRNAYAAGYSTNGVLVDVSNNVGKTNAALFPRFEVTPFAIGQTADAAAGQLVPSGAKVTFDLNLSDPFILGHIQSALNEGRLRFMVSSLHANGGQFGGATYPDFATHFNEVFLDPTSLELEGLVIGNGDLDTDGLPDDWEICALRTTMHSASVDVDADGVSNSAEFRAGTDPLATQSALRLTTQRDGNGVAALLFTTAASRRYAIQYSDVLPAWQTITNAQIRFTAPGTAHWVDLNSPAAPNRFYRVSVK